MRLIDADDFFARMENDTDLCAEMEFEGLKALKKYLDLQPTAYSVDKVVEGLERIRAKDTCNKEKCDTKELCRICVVDDAIEIVKQGSVSDDVCEWKKSKDYPFDWLVGCDGCEVNHSFTPLFTYKVLKRRECLIRLIGGFTPLFTYKVLKQQSDFY